MRFLVGLAAAVAVASVSLDANAQTANLPGGFYVGIEAGARTSTR
jgi:hypothetical protein